MLQCSVNGNMLTGLDGKIMTHDGENRPLSVRLNGKMTCYVYGADGTRLKKIENLAPAANCPAAPTAQNPVTATFANVEIRNFGQGTTEQTNTDPVSAIRASTSVPHLLMAIVPGHVPPFDKHRPELVGAARPRRVEARRSRHRPHAAPPPHIVPLPPIAAHVDGGRGITLPLLPAPLRVGDLEHPDRAHEVERGP